VTPSDGSSRADLDAQLARLANDVLPAGRKALDRLLPVFAAAMGGEAAVYRTVESGGLRREVAHGFELPERLEEAPRNAVAFEGGYLAWSPSGPAPEAIGGEATAIALAVTAAAREAEIGRRLRAQDFETKTRGVQLEALYDVGLAIASTLDLERLSEEILLRAVSLLDARRGALYLVKGGRMRLDRAFGGDAEATLDLGSEEVARLLAGEPSPNCCALPGAEHLLGVPIRLDGEPKGVLAVGDKESRKGVGPFRPEDRRTLELLANQAAIALTNAELHRQALEKERLEREIELASQIQREILPAAAPDVPGWELVGWNRPARHVGGDYYDFFVADEGKRVPLVLGDVSGKGVPAALLVSTLHSGVRLLSEREPISAELAERLNRLIQESSSSNKFITLFLADLDPATGELVYVNGGHNPALLRRADGRLESLGATGLPLGLLADSRYSVARIRLEPGDLLCLYSDGITEAESPAGEELGFERLGEIVDGAAAGPLDGLVDEIDRAVREISAGLPQGDDQTVLLLRRR